MFDHISIGVTNVAAVKPFYDAVMATLGYKCLYEEREGEQFYAAGYGKTRPQFWVCVPLRDGGALHGNGTHIAFHAETQQQVHDFYTAAIAHGGKDDGPPGPRPQYHEKYYAAFIYDPAGHKIEIVFGNA